MYYEFNEAGHKLFDIWADKYEKENDKLGGNSVNGDYIEGWSIIDNTDYIHTMEDECGLLVFGYYNYALDIMDEWIRDYGKDDTIGYGIDGTLVDLRKALEKYYIIKEDK